MPRRKLWALTGINYAPARVHNRVVAAGGLKRMKADDPDAHAEALKSYKRVEIGGRCDDLPPKVAEHWLRKGCVTDVDPDEGE